MQFADACFDVVLDKGSLDSLVGDGTESLLAATSYLSEVRARLDFKYQWMMLCKRRGSCLWFHATSARVYAIIRVVGVMLVFCWNWSRSNAFFEMVGSMHA